MIYHDQNIFFSKDDNNLKSIKLQINWTKLYVPIATLPMNNNIKFLENLKQEFERAVSWNKYKSGITIHPKKNTLYYMIDLSFRSISRLLDLPFKISKNEPTRNSYFEYYLPLIEIKVLIYILTIKRFSIIS